ncbi:MAG: ribonuclease D [Chloroflexi bacterium]|nr:ribonuclease D [Chloroflexota bacterium]
MKSTQCFKHIKPAKIIATAPALSELIHQLSSARVIGVDTESNSLYAYQERVCLIQLTAYCDDGSRTVKCDFIVDPLALDDLSELQLLFDNPEIELIFHAAEYDIMSLRRDFGFTFGRIFDTYVAARTLGWSKVSLRYLIDTYFGVQVDKRFQQADWSRRPLPPDQLCYAQMDTHFLPELRDLLFDELEAAGYVEEAYEYFDAVAEVEAAQRRFDPEAFWRIRTPREFDGQEWAILRELYLWRENTAEERDHPPFKIMRDSVLVLIAATQPDDLDALAEIKGISQRIVHQFGAAILAAIQRGRRQPPPQYTPHPSPDPQILSRYDSLHRWRKQKALARGVESDIILPRTALWALAHQKPTTLMELEDIPEIGPYRRQQYAAELLEFMRNMH